jgi:predicted TIM-barrel fold metal-dependent hydrolase
MSAFQSRFVILTLFLLCVGCGGVQEQGETTSGELTQDALQKIDFHTHFYHHRDYQIPMLEKWNMEAMIVNVFAGEDPSEESWDASLNHHDQHPDHYILCTSFDASDIDDPNFAQNVIEQLRNDISDGADMVKVWKNIGMVYQDAEGDYIQIDDPRFEPIWDFLAEQGIPVLAHIGEPRAAWRALDPESPHYTYYSKHPQYHFYPDPEIPTWTEIMQHRDNWIEQNPDLTIIGAHLGSMAYDIDEVAQRLDEYSNFYVEPAERFGDLAIQDSRKVREFFMDYQDRIMYGTDLRSTQPASELTQDSLEVEEELTRLRYQIHWDYLSTSDSLEFERTFTSFRTRTEGLGLPREVLEKVYYENAAKLLDLDDQDASIEDSQG